MISEETEELEIEESKPEKKRRFRIKLLRITPGERTQQIIGLGLILISFFLAISFISFLFTWKYDQDLLYGSWIDLLLDSEITVKNWLGKFGALTSHLFIHQGFGISSFLFVAAAFMLGIRVLFKVSLTRFGPASRIMLFSLVWVSTLMAYLFSYNYLFLGGRFGRAVNQWLEATFGGLGAGLFLFFVLAAFIIVNFRIPFDRIRQWINNLMTVDNEEANNDEEGFDLVAPETTPEESSAPEEEVIEPEVEELEIEQIESAVEEPQPEPEAEEDSSEELEIKEPEAVESSDEDVELKVDEFKTEEEVLDQKKIDALLKEQGEYDPTIDLSSFKLPPVDLLESHGEGKAQVNREELEQNKDKIVNTLRNYNIEISKIKATIGPTVTLYEIVPAPGVRISKIKNLEDDIALSLSALGIRIIAPIPGKGTIGIEVPNMNPDVVSMKTVISSDKFQNSDMELPLALGKTIQNETYTADLTKMPHLLMAGATGQGKSVGLNAILVSLLYKKHPSQVKFVLVDPKKVELTLFNKIERHYLAKLPGEEDAIITDTKKVINTLNSLCIEMDQRYDLLKDAHARNIKEYNAKFKQRKLNPQNGHRFLPYIVLVVDEFADLIMTAGKEVESPIARLAQLARAIGIHLIIATQRPSVNIITGLIKANFPSRIAFRVTAKIDSRTILDTSGADQLIGRGDMLISLGSEAIRLQCAFVDTPEVEKIVDFIGAQQAYPEAFLLPEYVGDADSGPGSIDDMDRDAMFEEAARVVVTHQQGSASLLQRKLKLGYNRAGRIVDQLEAAGIIGPFEGSKARQVLVPDELSLEHLLKSLDEEPENN